MGQDPRRKDAWVFMVLIGVVLAWPVASAGAWPVPDTGQTQIYATGDDGYYSINPHIYTDNSDGTVTDNGTTLMWEQQDDDKTRTWADANSYCEALTLAGYTDWRLPTVLELAILVDRSKSNPAVVDKTIFPGANTNNPYWSSSINTNLSYPAHAFHVKFNDGYVDYGDKTVGEYVRCVRGGPAQEVSKFVLNNGATATDVTTGLVWQRSDNGQAGWEQAITYCEGLSFDGFSDWRLPTINELLSITDYSYSYPSANSIVFPDINLTYGYWSSTVRASQTSYAWYVWFEYGNVGSSNIPLGYFRCVRSGPVNGALDSLVITSPNQGATVKEGAVQITWVDPQAIGGQVAISLSRKGGNDGTWETVAESTDNDGVYDWVVTGSESVNCVLKVEPIGASDKVGFKGLFSIAVPQESTTTTSTTTTTQPTMSTTTLPPTTTFAPTTTTLLPTTTTTTTIPVVDQPSSTIRIYPADGETQDYYSISDTVKLKANYRDAEGFDVDATALANWTTTNSLIADVGNGVSKGGAVTFKGNGEVRIFSFLNGLMDYVDFKVGSADVAKHHGNLIILAGGKGNDAMDALKDAIQYLCNRIYQVFKVRMFKDEDIYYINHKTDQDFNGDGVADGIVDQPTKSVQALTQAIQWAKDQDNDGPLYLYLVDHGEKNGTFLVDSNQVLSAAQLDGLLDDFESTGRTTVVILEACYSGSFLSALAGPHRVILTSANTDKYSFIGADGKVSFDQFFSNHLMVGKSWEDAFDLAVDDMQSLGLPYSSMMPQKSIGSQVTMGKVYGDFTMASLFPEMKSYTPGDSVAAEAPQDISVQLDVSSTKDVEVWGMVTPPNYQPPTVTEEFGTPVVNLDKIVLTPPEGSKDFIGQYSFPCAGAYSVTYYAKDSNGMVVASPPQAFDVSGKPCDFSTEVAPSWNLLSLPLTPVDPAVGKVLAQIQNALTSVWKWENGTWSVYLPGIADGGASYASGKGFGLLATLHSGEGFWVNSSVAVQLAVPGTLANGAVTLSSGWNLVGSKSSQAVTVEDVMAVNPQIVSIWKWENESWSVYLPGEEDKGESYAMSKGFGQFTTIYPGEGFWVNLP